MRVELKQFLALDSKTATAIKTLESAICSLDRFQISNAQRACEKLKESLADNVVRRHDYTSLCRTSIRKNRLLDNYIVCYLLIRACVDALTVGVNRERIGKPTIGLDFAIENRKTTYHEIEKKALILAKAGGYQFVLDILQEMSHRYSLNQSKDVLYFMIGECNKANNGEHARLVEDVIDGLDTLGIEPKSPGHIYKQVLLIDSEGLSVGDIDLAVLSRSNVWHIIEAKTGKKKNLKMMRVRAKRCLRHQCSYLKEKLGIPLKLIGVYRSNGAKKFDWFRCQELT